MIWLIVAALSVGVLAFLAWPLFRAQNSEERIDEKDYFAAQIADIDRDRAAGVLSDEEAQVADLEARRRLLGAARAERRVSAAAAPPALKQAAVLLVGAAPAAAVAMYLVLGNPALEPTQRAQTIAPAIQSAMQSGARPLAESIAALEARLAERPADLDGWVMLAESYAALDRFGESAAAYARAAMLSPEQAHLHAALGEALTMANDGVVSGEAQAALAKALSVDPTEPRARFYSAIALYQSGESEAALNGLVALANDAPDSAGWLPIVNRQISELAGELNAPVNDIGLRPRALARLAGPPASERAGGDIGVLEAQIASGDAPYTAWLALADAYAARGEIAKAVDVFDRAEARWASAPFVMQEIAAAKARLGAASPARRGPSAADVAAAQTLTDEQREGMIAGMVEGLAMRLEDNPDDFEGWIMLGRSYGVIGQYEKSIEAYARALAMRPEDLNVRIAHAQAMLARLEARRALIDEPTKRALEDILSRDASDQFALFFLGVAAQQGDDPATAKAHWEKLLARLPPESQEAAQVREMIAAL